MKDWWKLKLIPRKNTVKRESCLYKRFCWYNICTQEVEESIENQSNKYKSEWKQFLCTMHTRNTCSRTHIFLMKCEVVDNRSCFPILKKYVIIVCRAIINNHVPCWFYSIPVLISAVGIVFEQIVCMAVLLGKTT